MRLDASKIKQLLTIEHCELLLKKLGATATKDNDKETIYTSICHHKHADEHKAKLYFYKETKTFMCYSCSTSFDIFKLVQKRKQLLGEECSFVQAMEWVIDTVGLDVEKVQRIKPKEDRNIDHWEDDLSKYLKIQKGETLLKTYDKSVLRFFEQRYPQSWIDNGISIETMQKYGIGYYPLGQCATIPVYSNNGELIGIRGRNFNPVDLDVGKKYTPVQLLDGTQFKFPTNEVLYGSWYNQEAIKNSKTVVLVEAEKSVLQLDTMFHEKNFAVAMFGQNLGMKRRNWILEQGVDEVVIGVDFDYTEWGDKDYDKYEANVFKLAKMFTSYCKVSVLCSHGGHNKKDSPSDNGYEKYIELWNNREEIRE